MPAVQTAAPMFAFGFGYVAGFLAERASARGVACGGTVRSEAGAAALRARGYDVAVWPGDIVVGDAEGVVVIPAAIADAIAAEAVEMTAFEDFVQEKVLEGRSILGLQPPTEEATRSEFAAWRAARGR